MTHMVDDAMVRRLTSPYTTKQKIARALWMLFGQRVFSLTFHNWYGVRRGILRAFGASVGENARVRPTVLIEQPWNLTLGPGAMIGDRAIIYCLGKISIGENATVSQFSHLCAGTHDYTRKDFLLLRPPVVIEADAWVAAGAFVGPNVTIGQGAVVGACAVVTRSVEAWKIVAGNPAKVVKDRPRPV
jgi:putative colanic acid biosynthesis acetyltransferase WcaF